MKPAKLKESEHKEVSAIVESYREIETSLTQVQQQLQELDSIKDALLSQLDTIRSRELEFFQQLEKTYGKGKLDLYTLEYIKENNKDELLNTNLRVVD
jgi:hypothetical protein